MPRSASLSSARASSPPTTLSRRTEARHLVRVGETLSGIARRYGLRPQAIVDANPQLARGGEVSAGQVLRLPQPAARSSTAATAMPTTMPGSAPRPTAGARMPAANNGGLSSDTLRSRVEATATSGQPQAATAAQPTLRSGSRGAAVERLQNKLKAAGLNPGPTDGIFGPRTRAAVMAFQRARGIAVDGVVGPQTWGKLDQVSGSGAPSASRSGGSGPVLRSGSRGQAVTKLQNRLKELGFDPGPADGIFGPRTRSAVMAFQRARGIDVDGVVGPQTWNKLGIHVSGGASGPSGVPGAGASNAAKLDYAKRRAREIGLRITSTTGGNHVPGSYHYRGRAVDVAGPAHLMAQFYREMKQLSPTELFYDPLGGIKYGREIGAIGGHRDHVHVAF